MSVSYLFKMTLELKTLDVIRITATQDIDRPI